MKKAYLKVNDLGEGFFSSERILEARNYYGTPIWGFFDKDNIKNGRLVVSVSEKQEGDYVGVIVPQFFEDEGDIVLVKKSDLEYAT